MLKIVYDTHRGKKDGLNKAIKTPTQAINELQVWEIWFCKIKALWTQKHTCSSTHTHLCVCSFSEECSELHKRSKSQSQVQKYKDAISLQRTPVLCKVFKIWKENASFVAPFWLLNNIILQQLLHTSKHAWLTSLTRFLWSSHRLPGFAFLRFHTIYTSEIESFKFVCEAIWHKWKVELIWYFLMVSDWLMLFFFWKTHFQRRIKTERKNTVTFRTLT